MSLFHRISTTCIPRQVTQKLSRRISPNGKIHPSSFLSSSTCQSSYSTTPYNQSSERVDRIFDKILQLDTIEVHLLTELINEKMGISPMTAAQRAALSSQGGAGGAKAATAEPVEEKKTFDVKLTGFDASSKIKVIKEIRAITGLGLKEAKEMVEGVPKVVKKDIKMEDAEEIKSKLETSGATIEIV
jgi:large subunit ribosomal protein L7/L12